MDETELCFMPAVEAERRIRAKELSPVELMTAVLARIEALEPRINAFSALAAEAAMDGAKSAEAALTAGVKIGPLHGVPVTIKDLAPVAGLPFQRGSLIEADSIGTVDAPFVARLKAAGAIVLGKTTVPEFGWKGVSHSPLTGITHNPWKHGYNAGASSAGAGAAAAAGYGPLHQGSDGAGSIRMPSHFCGVYGLKPSFGRIPAVPVANGDQTSHIGPMTRTVADSALMLSVLAGPHPLDHYSLEGSPADYPALLDEGIEGLRVAYSPDLGHARVDAEVADLVAEAIGVFEAMGANVTEVTPAWASQGPELGRFFWSAHELRHRPWLAEWEQKMDPGLVACIRHAGDPTAVEYMAMRQRKLDYVAAVHEWFSEWDLLLTPAVSVAAFPAERLQPEDWPKDDWDWIMWAEFSYPFNFSHNPAASIPCGFTEAGLPVGLQIVGRRLDDSGVLRASAAFEAARPWADKRPLGNAGRVNS
jgi:aspartyl-tRNA(Asn)/glutamyl-tRNA(Gln) amidotransferase subunit A